MIFIIGGTTLLAQTNNNTIYFVFTGIPEDDDEAETVNQGVNAFDDDDDDDNDYYELYRSKVKFYIIYDYRFEKYSFKFIYQNRKDRENNPIISQPESFLSTVDYLDWDIIGGNLTKQQAQQIYQNIISHDKIYFINRNETENGTIKMVPVKVMKSAY